MTGLAEKNWQLVLADLALILFVTTGAALADDQSTTALSKTPASAIYVDHPDGPSLAGWLATQRPDPRQQLTILARFGEGGQSAALGRAGVLAEEALSSGMAPRIVILPGEKNEIVVAFAFDQGEEMAQALQVRAAG